MRAFLLKAVQNRLLNALLMFGIGFVGKKLFPSVTIMQILLFAFAVLVVLEIVRYLLQK